MRSLDPNDHGTYHPPADPVVLRVVRWLARGAWALMLAMPGYAA